MKALIAAILCWAACAVAPASAATPDPERDRAELRELLGIFTKAFNSGDLEPLLPYLHKDFSVTMVNQDVVTNTAELKGYLERMLKSPDSPLKDVKIAPKPDIATVFVDGRIGINRGGSIDTYTLRDGRVYRLDTRWTGTVIQDDGKWKVLTAHIGSNLLDNAVINEVEKLRFVWGAAGVAIGLALGALGAWLLLRRRLVGGSRA